ncbi:MAG: TonB-dependent receptor [Thermodesulfovibrionales bacterium]
MVNLRHAKSSWHFDLVKAVLLLLFSVFTTSAAYAHETSSDLKALSIEQLMDIDVATVQGASKYDQKTTEAPSSVSIITADEIKKYGYHTLADILRSVRSFHVTYDRNYNYVGVRGFGRPGDYNARVLVLVDGHRTNDNIYNSGSIGTEFLVDVDLIDRVEVIRGPGSSLYGSSAFFAVVNVITKSGRDLKGTEISAAGSFQAYKGRVSYGVRSQNDFEGAFSGSMFNSKGQRLFFPEFNNPATNNGITEHTDYDRSYSAFTKLSYSDLTLEGAYISRTKGIPTGSFGTDFNDPRNKTVDKSAFLDLKYERTISANLDITARLFYNSYNYTGGYLYTGTIEKDQGKGEWWGTEVKLVARPQKAHKVIFGTEYQADLRVRQKTFDLDPYFLFIDSSTKANSWALYIQDEYSISRELILNAGIRNDHYSTFGISTSPRIALIYNPFNKTTVKLLYGTAFRAPNAYELYYQSAPLQRSNPGLKPETIRTYEAVVEQYIGPHIRATAAGFYYKIRNLISQTTDPADNAIVFRNIEAIEAKGFEFELEGKWKPGLEGRLSYTFQRNKNLANDDILTNSPEHLVKLNLIVPFIKEKLFAGVEEQYTSRRKTLLGHDANSFFVTNLTLFSRNLLKKLEISGSVYNLFSNHYGDPGAAEHIQDIIRQDGRTFRVKVTYIF